MAGRIEITRAGPGLPADLLRLADHAASEGHRHLHRLIAEWESGTTRFDRPGEALLVATRDGQTIGIGGLTQDPHVPDALRVRRFYVTPSMRGAGLAGHMARQILATIPGPRRVTCHTPTPEATAFWRKLGFTDTDAPHHNLILTIP